MRISAVVLAAALALSAGCGASMTELVAQERWYDACETIDREDALHENQSSYLIGEAAATVEGSAAVHVFSVEELGEFLPHVPARMASGEVVLMMMEASYDEGPFSLLYLRAWPKTAQSVTRGFACCEAEQWMDLDGRREEWEALRTAQARASARAERYSGPLGGLRAMGDALAGVVADIAFISTIGVIDIDVSDLPMARLSGLQGLRAMGEAVISSMRRETPSEPADEAAALARRRAESLTILAHLTEEDRCMIDAPGSGCRAVHLYEVPPGEEVVGVQTRVTAYVPYDQSEICDIDATVESHLNLSGEVQPLSALLPRTALETR